MDGQTRCMQLLHEHGAVAEDTQGGQVRWKLPNGRTILTPVDRHGTVSGWLNRLARIRRLLGLTHSKTADESIPTQRSKKRHKLRVKASPGLTYQQLETQQPKTMAQKVISALGVSAIPQFGGVAASFNRRIDESLVYTSLPELQPQPTRSWPSLWHPPQPTPAECESQLEKWAGRKPWTEPEIRFADRVYYLCGPSDFRVWVAAPHLEDSVITAEHLESEIRRIEEEIAERDRIIAAAETAKDEKPQLHTMLEAMKMALEESQKGASLMRASKAFTLQPKRLALNGAIRKPRQYRDKGGTTMGLHAILAYLNNQPLGATFTTHEIMSGIGSDDVKKVGSALTSESSVRGKQRTELVRKEGKACWWRITDAGRASVRSEGTHVKPSNGHTESAAALR